SDGRGRLTVQGFDRTDAPGRPGLPYASTLIALPPGARPSVRVIGDGDPEARDGVKLGVAGRPAFERGADDEHFVPIREPVAAMADGAGPPAEAAISAPFTMRRMRVATLTLTPVRYDEGAGRLYVRRTLTVRVDFSGGTPVSPTARVTPDRSW